MTEIKLYKSNWRAIKLILISSIFVCLGFWGILTGNMSTWMAWLSIGFFGLGLPIGMFHLFDKRPQIIINEIGIFDRTTSKDFINWEVIQDAYIIDIHRQIFICIIVGENFKPSQTKSKLYQQTAKLSEAIGAQELNISLGQININPDKLLQFILLMRTATKPDKSELINQTLQEWRA